MKLAALLFVTLISSFSAADLNRITELSNAQSMHARMAYFELLPKQNVVMFDAKGPGKITHIWTTIGTGLKEGSLVEPYTAGATDFRDFIIRMYWDDEKRPSVEVPLSELFGCGFGIRQKHHSIVSAADGRGGFVTYWQMPFAKAARIELYNDTQVAFPVYWNIDWEKYDKFPKNTGYFHSHYRTAQVDCFKHHLMLEAEGRGHFAGLVYSVEPSTDKLWWGEGDEFFYIDGDVDPTIRGTGTEDYFNQSWGLKPAMRLYTGFYEYEGNRKSMYRYHIKDPVHFRKSFRAEFEQLYGSLHRVDFVPHTNVSSTVFWYQTEPHKTWENTLPEPAPMEQAFENVNIKNCRMLDISRVANMALVDKVGGDGQGGWVDQGKYLDLSPLPTGKRRFAGVPFNIKNACIVLHTPDRPFLPKTSQPLKINDSAKKIYFFIGTAWGQSFGLEPAGSVKIHYKDSSEQQYTFKMGRDLTDWFRGAPNHEMTSKPWHFINEQGNRFYFYVVEWENPHPEKVIDNITFHHSGARPALGVTGITLYK